MTVADLVAHLREYPSDTPIVDGKGYDLRWSDIGTRAIDIWLGLADPDGDGYETPETGIAVSIGRRF